MSTLLPGLSDDVVVVRRADTGTDAEGNPDGTLTTILTTPGTWGTPTYRDRTVAAQSGQEVDAVVALATPAVALALGDVVVVRDRTYRLAGIGDTRFHTRLFLSAVQS